MDRRTYLATLGTGALAGLAGCIGDDGGISSEQLSSADGTADGWGQHTKLAASDDSVNQFGRSVALAGDGRTALVTADHHEAGDEFKPGPAFVLERTEGDWGLLAELTPDGGEWDGNFGGPGDSAALSDDASTALVGAERADDPNGPEAGAAYLFERSDGEWAQARLVADDGSRKDFFGGSVALDGDGSTALVGAKRDEDPNRESAGSVYVFEPTDGGWRQRAKLTPGPDSTAARFGWSVDLAGDTVLVGAPGDTDPDERAAGSASVFRRDGDGWRRRATLAADDGDAGDFFGGAVALEADTALVGAMEDDDPNGDRGGSAYVFERTDGSWSQQAKLVPDDGDRIDLFGAAVALSGDTALVGARVDEDPNGEVAGSAYVFERSGGAWSQQAKLVPADGGSHDVFGRSVALAAGTALIGSTRAGAYVF